MADPGERTDRGTLTWRALVKLLIGFGLGFVGAFVTLQAIDRFAPAEEPEPLEIVVGAPDFDAFCERDGERLRAVATSGDAFGWQCVGTVRGLWTSTDIGVGDACRWLYGAAASERLVDESAPDGWMCVTDP